MHMIYSTHPLRRAFTLIELLVTISIIALLIGLLLPALGAARDTARQARGLSDLRQMLLGYTVYQSDHGGQVLWGYTPASIGGSPVQVKASSGHVFGLPVADRYPWRLAPYVGDLWEILHSHATTPPLPQASDSPGDALLKAYQLSLTPTYGINSIYVGGHNGVYQGFVLQGGDYQPNRGKHVVFHQDEPKAPSQLIVFAEAQARVGTASPFNDQPQAGLHFATPPRAKGHHWRAVGDTIENLQPSNIAGIPESRHHSAAITGFFDGHVSAMRPEALDDMRLWANGVRDAQHDPIP